MSRFSSSETPVVSYKIRQRSARGRFASICVFLPQVIEAHVEIVHQMTKKDFARPQQAPVIFPSMLGTCLKVSTFFFFLSMPLVYLVPMLIFLSFRCC